MDIFSLQSSIMDEYESYISSFININDEEISRKIEAEIKTGKLWPQPLIQFNPSYKIAGPVTEFCDNGLLHSELKNFFGNYNLYKHQVDALELGTNGRDFIVTSGTGSGKSLTYMATIFNHILTEGSGKGVQAIIVYPMNALINSQAEEINEFKKQYEDITNNRFPVTYGQFTGQEDEDARNKMRNNPPDILLTNYMMLELLMTRNQEERIRNSIFDNLQYLVFDELHTYRGRQGSDVALLIRRIKAKLSNEPVCIGTSATMISGGTIIDQKRKVAEVASTLFGKKFTTEQIVDETLVRSLHYDGSLPSADILKNILAEDIDISKGEDVLKTHPLGIWLENVIALEVKEDKLVRQTPGTLDSIVDKLNNYTGIDKDICENRILQVLKWISAVNSNKSNLRNAYLPFKLHQFISQTGSVYVTLHQDNNRVITLEPGVMIGDKETGKPLFPVVFSRYSGHPFICVYKDHENGKLRARELNEMNMLQEDEEDNKKNFDNGYIIAGENVWEPDSDIQSLPDAWLNQTKGGQLSVKRQYQQRVPQKIYFDADGNFSEDSPLEYEGWYMPARLLFDPTSGTFFESNASERSKLASLGTEGRSTSTTVLSLLILMQMKRIGFSEEDQKILSFTDNRQDAALQSGHFNDFIDVIQLRSAIFRALKVSEKGVLDHTNIAHAVFEALLLDQNEYSQNPSTFPGAQKDNENALKDYLMYRILFDLRRSWRVILPNLEQCALLKITYKYLDENCEVEDAWQDVPLIGEMETEKRKEVVYQVLDYIRKTYAIHSEEYLNSEVIDRRRKNIQEKLKDRWRFDSKEEIILPFYVSYEKVRSARNLFTRSVGSRSALGKYLKDVGRDYGYNFNDESYNEFIQVFLRKLGDAGWLKREKAYTADNEETEIYQLVIDQILWQKGDEESVEIDLVKTRSYKRDFHTIRPNEFFYKMYRLNFGDFKKLEAKDHTGQIQTEDRRFREAAFRDGIISALYCSPTMELGINIATLNVVHMRNVPPNPANYAQRSGRAGRNGQSALIFTFCSSFSSHDRNYFHKSKEMVAGAVAPPQIDIENEELLGSHLHSVYLSEMGGRSITNSIRDLLEDFDVDPSLPILDDVKANLTASENDKSRIKQIFLRVISDINQLLKNKFWYTDDWIDVTINNTVIDFDRSLDRWRFLYREAVLKHMEASRIQTSGRYKARSEEMKKANIDHYQSKQQINLLCNTDSSGALSEFYPYRYFAAEGFLPGYNFTRLPVRTFIPQGDSGVYISRPRFIAIREFGPRNIIYYGGSKYQVNQLVVSEADQNLKQMKISKHSGYCCMEEEYNSEVCPITGELLDGNNKNIIPNLIEMTETHTWPRERISCEEEERLMQGFEVDTYFNVPGSHDRVKLAVVKNEDEDFLNIRYIPAARLIQINNGWRTTREKGFLMGMTSGFWKKESDLENPNTREDITRVRLYTSDTADALYIEPTEPLGLDSDGVITLQYALKRAIENIYQVEPSEIAVTLMGDAESPNIFIYEAAEGSLGILSQFVEDAGHFMRCVDEAYDICRYDDKEYREPASYDDLLSYYNQRYHSVIDRWLIKDALEKLRVCRLDLQKGQTGRDYEEQFKWLLERYDHSSQTELKFLEYLYKNNLRLPDDAQRDVSGIFVRPDFYYEPNVWVFCDGTPHDNPATKASDDELRQAIFSRGDRVIVYRYDDSLDELTRKHADIFRKVR